ncbi:hypothetical Protein YC6258_01697 [Gynuella sunshinyii YC6258]|uniref:Uncharacterized protein n=1 Tax=Gynuella sunshinyii YC6258 TaxID=1445510 RepID=A0A0C5VTV3_9GAMM|nr:hypothetical Protein YC6258_01697 [Gynuella sunshinyii YC6258]
MNAGSKLRVGLIVRSCFISLIGYLEHISKALKRNISHQPIMLPDQFVDAMTAHTLFACHPSRF